MKSVIQTDPEHIAYLAQNYDPAPVLASLGGSVGSDGSFQAADSVQGNPYSAMISGAQNGPTGTDVPGASPLSLTSLAMLNNMMPKPQQPHFAPAPGVRQPTPVNIHIPDVSNLVKVNLGAQHPAPTPSLGQLIGGR